MSLLFFLRPIFRVRSDYQQLPKKKKRKTFALDESRQGPVAEEYTDTIPDDSIEEIRQQAREQAQAKAALLESLINSKGLELLQTKKRLLNEQRIAKRQAEAFQIWKERNARASEVKELRKVKNKERLQRRNSRNLEIISDLYDIMESAGGYL